MGLRRGEILGLRGTDVDLDNRVLYVCQQTQRRRGVLYDDDPKGRRPGWTQIGARLMTRVPPRFLMAPGFLTAAVGMLLLTQLEVGSSYAGLVLPADG